jgi:hypothetical protein
MLFLACRTRLDGQQLIRKLQLKYDAQHSKLQVKYALILFFFCAADALLWRRGVFCLHLTFSLFLFFCFFFYFFPLYPAVHGQRRIRHLLEAEDSEDDRIRRASCVHCISDL